MPARSVAAVTGVLWIVYAAVRLTKPAYWAPVTPVDYAAVVLFSAAMLGLGLCLWSLGGAGVTRIVARIASLGAIVNSAANLLEDLLGFRAVGGVWVLSALVTALTLMALAGLLFRSGARAFAAVALLTVIGLFLTELGGSALVGATWLAVALRWPVPQRTVSA